MLRGLVVTFVTLTALLQIVLAVPLAFMYSVNEIHRVAVPRIDDAERFGAQAIPILMGTDDRGELRRAMNRYDDTTGFAVLLFNRHGSLVVASRPVPRLPEDWRVKVDAALKGKSTDIMGYEYDLASGPLFIAEPVKVGGAVIGAVAILVAKVTPREALASRLSIHLSMGILFLAVALSVSILLARWMLRPIGLLAQAAEAITRGRHTIRAPEDAGPVEIRGMARSFNTMADRLVTLLQTQRRFVADASHQMRNPLTSLRLRVESLEPVTTEAGKPLLRLAVAETERVSRILDELLALARAESGNVPTQPVDAAAVTRARAEAWRPVASRRDIRILDDTPPLVVACAPGTLDQVLDILLDNAIQYSPSGAAIRVNLTIAGTGAEVRVVDSGPGLSEEHRARAGDRFWRAPTAHSEGSGIGLSIARALLTASGGQIRLEPVSPHGLEAVVVLPLCTDAPPRLPPTAGPGGG